MRSTLFVSVLCFLIIFTACDGSNDNSDSRPFCQLDEFIERVDTAECLADELLIGCRNIDCSGDDPITSAGDLRSCSFVDCNTLSCENIIVNVSSGNTGLMADISVDEITGLPIGVFVLEDFENDFICGLFND